MDLFSYAPSYPLQPGYRDRDTSRQAGESINVKVIRAKVLAEFERPGCWWTADEVASRLNLSVLSVRPRVCELSAMGKIRDSGERRKNASGRSATVWRLV